MIMGLSLLCGFYVGKSAKLIVLNLKLKRNITSKVSIFLIENDFRAVNTNVIVDTCMLLGIYLLIFPAQLSIR